MSDCSYVKNMNQYKKDNNINENIRKGTEHHANIMAIIQKKKEEKESNLTPL